MEAEYTKDTDHNQLDINYHDTIASEYDPVVNEPRRLSNRILFEPLLKLIKKPVNNYLDLGCGTGQMIERIGTRFKPKETWAVDHSKEMLAQSEFYASKNNINNFNIIHDDILSFIESCSIKFSVISMVGVIHHLKSEHISHLLNCCYKALEDDGYLLIAEPVDENSLYNTPNIVKWWNKKSFFVTRGYSKSVDEPDEHPLAPGFLEDKLQKSNLKIIKMNRGIELFPHNNPPSLVDRIAISTLQKIYGSKGFVCAWLIQKGKLSK